MKDYIEERAMEIAGYIIDTNATVRQAAKQFGISKSTVHSDVTKRNGLRGRQNRKVVMELVYENGGVTNLRND